MFLEASILAPSHPPCQEETAVFCRHSPCRLDSPFRHRYYTAWLEAGEETVDCAICRNPMITLELDNVETDYCLACRGIWLDSGELEQLLGDSKKAQEVLQSFQPAEHIQEHPRRCPICGKKMEKVLVGPESASVLLDRCGKGHGLWFDRGELEAVLQMGRFDSQKKIPSFLGKMFQKSETNSNPTPSSQ